MKRDLPLIAPINQPLIDWSTLVKVITDYTGRSPIRPSADSGDYLSYISALGVFSSHRPFILKHLQFSFIIQLTEKEYVEILRESDLICLDNIDNNDEELLVIVTGAAFDWLESCKTFCSKDYTFRVRYIFDAIFLYFEKLKIFKEAKSFLLDQTFIIN